MLIRGDARHIPLKDETVQCVVTSPPYWGLRAYSDQGDKGIGLEKTPEEYVEKLVQVFREVWRVLKKDGTVWLNLGDSYATSAGKGDNVPQTKWPANTYPTNAPHRNKFRPGCGRADGTVDERGQRNRNGVGPVPGLKPKDLVGIPWRVAFALQTVGWYLRSEIIWAKSNPMPESVTDRPTKSHEQIFLLAKSERYYFDQDAVREDHLAASIQRTKHPWNGERARDYVGSPQTIDESKMCHPNGRNLRSVWTIATQPYPESHFATFPEAIPERCIKAGSRPGDIVLDPFCGSGTTVRVAERLQRIGIGIDLAYQDLAKKRVKNNQVEMCL